MEDKKRNVLIVEDESVILQLLSTVLEMKYDCSTAENAMQALSLIKNNKFDLILADVGLPGLSGLELCHIAQRTSPQTLVVLMSGMNDEDSAKDATKAGAFDFLKKPFNLSEAMECVERALNSQNESAMRQQMVS